MILYPVPTHDNGPLGLFKSYYRDGQYLVNFKLDKAEDGTITILRDQLMNGGRCYTDLIVSPTEKGIYIEHRVEKKAHYTFETPDHHGIGVFAEIITQQGAMDEATAKQLSACIDKEIAACREKRIGRIIEATEGWQQAVKHLFSNTKNVQSASCSR